MASLGRRSKNFTPDGQTARFLYTILKQLDLKTVDWNEVAESLDITNGHAARMRYSRFKQHIEGTSSQPRKERAKKNAGEKKLGLKRKNAEELLFGQQHEGDEKKPKMELQAYTTGDVKLERPGSSYVKPELAPMPGMFNYLATNTIPWTKPELRTSVYSPANTPLSTNSLTTETRVKPEAPTEQWSAPPAITAANVSQDSKAQTDIKTSPSPWLTPTRHAVDIANATNASPSVPATPPVRTVSMVDVQQSSTSLTLVKNPGTRPSDNSFSGSPIPPPYASYATYTAPPASYMHPSQHPANYGYMYSPHMAPRYIPTYMPPGQYPMPPPATRPTTAPYMSHGSQQPNGYTAYSSYPNNPINMPVPTSMSRSRSPTPHLQPAVPQNGWQRNFEALNETVAPTDPVSTITTANVGNNNSSSSTTNTIPMVNATMTPSTTLETTVSNDADTAKTTTTAISRTQPIGKHAPVQLDMDEIEENTPAALSGSDVTAAAVAAVPAVTPGIKIEVV